MCMLILISVLAGSKCHRNRNFILYIWCDTVMSQLIKPTYWCFRMFHKYMILAEQDCLTLIQTQCFKSASQLCARIGSWNDTYGTRTKLVLSQTHYDTLLTLICSSTSVAYVVQIYNDGYNILVHDMTVSYDITRSCDHASITEARKMGNI